MPLPLSELWRRWWPGATAPIVSVKNNEFAGRISEADQTEWMLSSRPSPPFSLDVCFDAPSYVPGWMLQDGSRETVQVTPTPLANDFGYVPGATAIGREAALSAHYHRILHAAPDWRRWRASHSGCFKVDIVIRIEGEPELRLEMFNGAASGAAEFLGLLANAEAPSVTLYDSLDQGWALRMVTTHDAVFTLEWNWEIAAADDNPRALCFPRSDLVVQSAAALARLRHVHRFLVQDLGADLWNRL